MGNAFVAIADDQQAIYHNVAGVNFQKKMGRPKKFLGLSYYPSSNHFLSFGFVSSQNLITARDLDVALRDSLTSNGIDFKQIVTQFANLIINNDSLVSSIILFNRSAIPFFFGFHTELTISDKFSSAIWVNSELYPFLDLGFIPRFGQYYSRSELVGQFSFSSSVSKRLSVGLGFRLVYLKESGFQDVIVTDPFLRNNSISVLDSLENLDIALPIPSVLLSSIESSLGLTNNALSDHPLLRAIDETIGSNPIPSIGLDFGLLWQQTPEIRFGLSLQNVFIPYIDKPLINILKGLHEKMTGLNQRTVIPKLTLGTAYSPIIFQKNYGNKRTVNFALDFEDILSHRTGTKNTSVTNFLNFGFEVKQNLGYKIQNFSGTRLNRNIFGFRLAAGARDLELHWGIGIYLLNTLQFDITSWVKKNQFFHIADDGRIHNLSLQINI